MRLFPLLVLWLFAHSVSAQLYTHHLDWKKLTQPLGVKNTGSRCIAEVPGQGFVWAGYVMDAHFATDIFVQRIDYDGNVLWDTTFGGDWYDTPYRIRVHPDGSFAVLGFSGSTGISLAWHFDDAVLIKYGADNQLQWWRRYGSANPSDDDFPSDFRICSDGGYVVCGGINKVNPDGTKRHDAWIFKTDATGQLQWDRRYGGTGMDVAYSVVQTPDLGYAVTVSSQSADGDFDLLTHETDPWLLKLNEIGLIQWKKHYGGTETEHWYHIENAPDGGFMLAGEIEPGSDLAPQTYGVPWDAWVCRTAADGTLLWSRNFGGSKWDGVRSFSTYGTGLFWVGGFTLSHDYDICRNRGQDDFWVFAVDMDGRLVWSQTFGGSGYDHALGIAALADGFIVCGEANSDDGDVGPVEPYESGWILRVSHPQTFHIDFPQSDTTFCGEGAITLALDLPDSIQARWNTGFVGNQLSIDAGGLYAAEASLYGCTSADTIQVERTGPPEFPADTVLCQKDSIWLAIEADADRVVWNDAGEGYAIWAVEAGWYRAAVQIGACMFVDSVRIGKQWCEEEAYCLKFPNAFTPNRDGVNDTFGPILGCGVVPERVDLLVYNRWGELVFRGTDPLWPRWDGSGLPADLYVWRCAVSFMVDGEPVRLQRHGEVNLLR